MVSDYDAAEIPSVYNLAELPPARDEPGLQQVFFRGLDQMLGLTRITPDREDGDPHTHPWEQVNMLLEGRIGFAVDGERVELDPYDALVIPPEVPHTTYTVSDDPALLLACWPLREDRLDETTYQREFEV